MEKGDNMRISYVSVPVQDPVNAHHVYTTRLGFVSKLLDADGMLAIVASPQDPNGTCILLEPCTGTFAEDYQRSAYAANLPIIVFDTDDLTAERARLSAAGVVFRDDLAQPDTGLENLFEDGCGNLIMLEAHVG